MNFGQWPLFSSNHKWHFIQSKFNHITFHTIDCVMPGLKLMISSAYKIDLYSYHLSSLPPDKKTTIKIQPTCKCNENINRTIYDSSTVKFPIIILIWTTPKIQKKISKTKERWWILFNHLQYLIKTDINSREVFFTTRNFFNFWWVAVWGWTKLGKWDDDSSHFNFNFILLY